MNGIREMILEEFIRRLGNLVKNYEDTKFVFFLGAGCSISSGIPGTKTLVKNWLPRLKRLKTGNEDDLDSWMKTECPTFEESKPSLFYGKLIEELFLTADERQREIEKIIAGKDPGFGYAVLAQLMTHDQFGRNCNVVLTVNFDDLIADALYLYTRKKPLVILHESLAGFVRITRTRPLIIKLHGDARLAPKNTKQETAELSKNLEEVLKNLLQDSGLIFIGYGGNDKSIIESLRKLPANALPLGVYWINDKLPGSEMQEWLEERNAVFVKHQDFDEFMLLLREEFGLSHPPEDRFEKIINTYFETFDELGSKILALPPEKEVKPLKTSLERAINEFKWWGKVVLEARKYEKKDPEKAYLIYQEGMKKFPNTPSLLSYYAFFLTNIRKEHDKAEEFYQKALELEPNNAVNLGSYAIFLKNIRKEHDKAEEFYQKALELDPNNAPNLGNYAIFLTDIRKEHDKAEEFYQKALELEPNNAAILGSYAIFLKNIRKEHDKAEEFYQKALELDPNNAVILGNYAIFLSKIRKDFDKAEELFKKALEIEPDDANQIGNYAGFLLAWGNEKGNEFLSKAIKFLKKDLELKTSLLECYFYQFAHSKDVELKMKSLEEIKILLEENVRSPNWDLSLNLERAIKDKHPHLNFLKKLIKVINDELELKELKRFKIWQKIDENKS